MFDPTRYTLAKGKHGNWEIRWTEDRGDRYVQRTHSTRETERAAAETYRRHWVRAQEELSRQLQGVPTVAELIDHYELNANYRKVGGTQYRLLGYLRGYFGDLLPSSITETDIARYRNKRGVSDASMRRELGVLVAVFNHGVRKKLLSAGDVPHIDLPPDGQPREVYLTASEERAFMDIIMKNPTSKFSLFSLIALRTGARRSAIEGLVWDRVDLEGRIIDYRDAKLKSSKKRRVPVPIDGVLFPVLQQAYVFSETDRVIGKGPGTQLMFNKFRAENPSLKHITPHVLRHTAASRWLRDGMSIWDVAGLLGDTVETVTRVYGHHSTSDLRAAMDRSAA